MVNILYKHVNHSTGASSFFGVMINKYILKKVFVSIKFLPGIAVYV